MSSVRILTPKPWSSPLHCASDHSDSSSRTQRVRRPLKTHISDEAPSTVSKKDGNDSNRAWNNLTSISLGSESSKSPSDPPKEVAKALPTSESPSSSVTRKRAASVGKPIEEAPKEFTFPGHPRGVASSGESLSRQVCLCQPVPKIPRPRNAFILYRQHHQAAIVAQNPGLANPEISKIIGEQWQSQPDSVKQEWKTLAEEEKLRHQQQYPEYRYKPRRLNIRPSSAVDGPTSSIPLTEKARCSKCGGRSIRTPTSAVPHLHQPGSALPSPTSASSPNMSGSPNGRYPPSPNVLGLPLPQSQLHLRRRAPGPSGLSAIQGLRSPAETDSFNLLSPDSKRRRFNYNGYGAPEARPGNLTPYPFVNHARRESLPRPDLHLQQSSPSTASMMGPPAARPGHRRDLSLTLPPLAPPHAKTEEQRSVEEVVSSMPYVNKIKLLGQIAPPLLKAPSPAPGQTAVRGALISVEGDDLKAVQSVVNWLENFLSRSGEYAVQVAEAPKLPDECRKDVTIADYLEVILEWHLKSRRMVDFITAHVSSKPRTDSATSLPPKDRSDQAKEPSNRQRDRESSGSLYSHSSSRSPSPTYAPQAPHNGSSSTQPNRLPILVLPDYQVRTTDAFTTRVPIADTYNALDHWQWMATLWRGIVGPDLTVFVKELGAGGGLEEGGSASVSVPPTPRTAVGPFPSGGSSGKEKTVELKEDVRTLVVRKKKGEGIEEGAMRRVGFEVGEWIRGVSAGGEKHAS